MKNIDYTLRARLQLLGIVAVIAVFAIILVSKFGCSATSSDATVEKKTKKLAKTLPSIPEPRFLKKSELIPFMQQLSWAKAKSNNIKLPRIANYPTAGILIDLNTNEVIWAKNPEMQVPIAAKRSSYQWEIFSAKGKKYAGVRTFRHRREPLLRPYGLWSLLPPQSALRHRASRPRRLRRDRIAKPP